MNKITAIITLSILVILAFLLRLRVTTDIYNEGFENGRKSLRIEDFCLEIKGRGREINFEKNNSYEFIKCVIGYSDLVKESSQSEEKEYLISKEENKWE